MHHSLHQKKNWLETNQCKTRLDQALWDYSTPRMVIFHLVVINMSLKGVLAFFSLKVKTGLGLFKYGWGRGRSLNESNCLIWIWVKWTPRHSNHGNGEIPAPHTIQIKSSSYSDLLALQHFYGAFFFFLVLIYSLSGLIVERKRL